MYYIYDKNKNVYTYLQSIEIKHDVSLLYSTLINSQDTNKISCNQSLFPKRFTNTFPYHNNVYVVSRYILYTKFMHWIFLSMFDSINTLRNKSTKLLLYSFDIIIDKTSSYTKKCFSSKKCSSDVGNGVGVISQDDNLIGLNTFNNRSEIVAPTNLGSNTFNNHSNEVAPKTPFSIIKKLFAYITTRNKKETPPIMTPVTDTTISVTTTLTTNEIDKSLINPIIYKPMYSNSFESIESFDPTYYIDENTTIAFPIYHKNRKLVYYNKVSETQSKHSTINLDDYVLCVRFISNDIPQTIILPSRLYSYVTNIKSIGLNIDIKDILLFPKEHEGFISSILQHRNVSNDEEYIRLMYSIRKILSQKPDFGKNIRYVLEFLYSVYEFSNTLSTSLPLENVYDDFIKYCTYNFCFEMGQAISPDKLYVILEYLGVYIVDGRIQHRKKRIDSTGDSFMYYKRNVHIAQSMSFDKIKPNTSYRFKKTLQLRTEPKVAYYQSSVWNVPSNANIKDDSISVNQLDI